MNDELTVADVFEGQMLETEADFKEMGDLIGLEGEDLDKYARFMREAFGNAQHWTYAKEWAERFQKDDPTYAMDLTRQRVYEEVEEAI